MRGFHNAIHVSPATLSTIYALAAAFFARTFLPSVNESRSSSDSDFITLVTTPVPSVKLPSRNVNRWPCSSTIGRIKRKISLQLRDEIDSIQLIALTTWQTFEKDCWPILGCTYLESSPGITISLSGMVTWTAQSHVRENICIWKKLVNGFERPPSSLLSTYTWASIC